MATLGYMLWRGDHFVGWWESSLVQERYSDSQLRMLLLQQQLWLTQVEGPVAFLGLGIFQAVQVETLPVLNQMLLGLIEGKRGVGVALMENCVEDL